MDSNKISEIKSLISGVLSECGLNDKVAVINEIREHIHDLSPFKNEPVDFVKWVISDDVTSNDYNPNKVAPPEMELLEISIINDGYTQPIVTWQNDEKEKIEVIKAMQGKKKPSHSVQSWINSRRGFFAGTWTILEKPLSVNEAWQGKRYKTPKYINYERALKLLLPDIEIPEGNLEINFTFGFSNKASDLDNPVKPILDIMQKKYGFNDSRVYRITVDKQIVKKGQEFFSFAISKLC